MRNCHHAVLAAALLLFSLGGCASITSGNRQTVFVETPQAEGALCRMVDSGGGRWYVPKTPDSVTVQTGDGPLHVICEKDGYETTIATIQETVAPAVFGNILAGGIIGIFVDSATGAAQKYPDRLVVWMKPNGFASKEEEAAWHKSRNAYEGLFVQEPGSKEITSNAASLQRAQAYFLSNKRDLENRLFVYIRERMIVGSGDSGLDRPIIDGYRILEADENRVVASIAYRTHRKAMGDHPINSQEFLMQWQGRHLVFISHKGIFVSK